MVSAISSDNSLRVGARGGGVTVIGQLLKLAIQFSSVVVLSRFLDPTDFGLVAMVMVFVTLAEMLRDLGLSAAALQAPSLSRQQASNFFWLNASLGLVLALLLVLCSPLIVSLYGTPALVHIIPAFALVIILNGAQAQFQVQIARQLRFTMLTSTDVIAQLFGFGVAVLFALSGFGYWALIAQLVLAAALLLMLRVVLSRWRPAVPRRDPNTLPLLRSAGHLAGSQMLTWAASNADTVVIGSKWDASVLGFYNRAFQLLTVPVSRMLGPLTQVAVPGISNAKGEGHAPQAVLLRVQSLLGISIIAVFAVSSSVSPVLLPILLGDGWGDVVPLFQILALGGAFQCLSYVSYWGFLLSNNSRSLFRYNLVTKPLTLVLVLAGANFGVAGVAWAYSIGLVLAWPINLVWLRAVAQQHVWPFLSSGLLYLVAGVASYFSGRLLVWSTAAMDPVASLAISIAGACAAYFLVLLVFPTSRVGLWLIVNTIRKAVS